MKDNIQKLIENGGWRPIEEAPKDGSGVLLYDANRNHVYTGNWDEQKHHTKPRPFWQKDARYHDIAYQRTYPPTHFMPLDTPERMAEVIIKMQGMLNVVVIALESVEGVLPKATRLMILEGLDQASAIAGTTKDQREAGMRELQRLTQEMDDD